MQAVVQWRSLHAPCVILEIGVLGLGGIFGVDVVQRVSSLLDEFAHNSRLMYHDLQSLLSFSNTAPTYKQHIQHRSKGSEMCMRNHVEISVLVLA
jgi:hypothetical protein